MQLSAQIAQQFRAVYYSGNWTASNLKDQLSAISWEEALVKIKGCNTIAVLLNHLHYYPREVTRVLEGGALEARDKYSFEHPPIHSKEDWEQWQEQIWKEADRFAELIEQMPEEQWEAPFAGGDYGNYYRNITGIIEHVHYHLGQIALLRKLVRTTRVNAGGSDSSPA